jgi:hypothetical protein
MKSSIVVILSLIIGCMIGVVSDYNFRDPQIKEVIVFKHTNCLPTPSK